MFLLGALELYPQEFILFMIVFLYVIFFSVIYLVVFSILTFVSYITVLSSSLL